MVHWRSKPHDIEISASFGICSDGFISIECPHVHLKSLRGNDILKLFRKSVFRAVRKDNDRVAKDTHYLGDAFIYRSIQLFRLLSSVPKSGYCETGTMRAEVVYWAFPEAVTKVKKVVRVALVLLLSDNY